MANFYESRVFPRICDLCMRRFGHFRHDLVASATGRVVELGAGTCENARHLGAIDEYVAVEPSPGMRRLANDNLRRAQFSSRFIEAPGESVPLESGAFDTVLLTFVLCTVRDPAATLREAKRLLAPNGTLLVIEHVRDPNPAIARWQERLDPAWRVFACGCELARDSASALAQAGFDTRALEHHDVDAPPFFKHLIRGRLTLAA